MSETAEAVRSEAAAKPIGAPMAMLAELTHRCPFSCPYCSNPLELDRKSKELTADEWGRVFDEAAALGVLQIHLSGGEPLARSDLPEIVARAAKAGLYTNLITAAATLTEAMLDRLMDAGLDHVQISFDGATAEVADPIGGLKGGHARKLAAARLVRARGMPLTVNAVMHRRNLHELPAIIDLAMELDAARLEVANVQYYGWALKNRAALMPTPDQVRACIETVRDARARLDGRLVIDYVSPDYYARFPKPCMGGWGRMSLNITPQGRVLPCHAAESIPGLVFDSVREHDLAWIWANSSAFRAYRGTDWMEEPCRTCERREIDWGGCRCQAMALTGRATATDPACSRSDFNAQMRATAEAEAGAGEPPAFIHRSY